MVLGIALGIAVAEIAWALFQRPGDFQGLYPPTLGAPEVLALVAIFALLLGVGVGLAKAFGWVMASREAGSLNGGGFPAPARRTSDSWNDE